MLKSIPKSNISKRAFPVYKQWEVTQVDYPIISASLEGELFDTGSSNKQGNIYTTPLYRSIKSKFYNTSSADIFNTFGRYNNLSSISGERELSDTIYVLKIPQSKYGEEIKPGSISFEKNEIELSDDNGNLISNVPEYILTSIDFENAEIIIVDGDGQEFNGTIINSPNGLDLNTGNFNVIFESTPGNFEVVLLDIQNNKLQTAQPLSEEYPGIEIDQLIYGNVFYDEGLFVLNESIGSGSIYNLNYRSTKTIYETEILVTARAGEFNYSQNPSAVVVTLSGSYDFETTAIPNSSPAGTKKIKEVLDITRKDNYTGSIGNTVGSWDDYFEYGSTDLTGSYLAPFITTIGLYDDNGDMVAIAKLPTPIKNLPDYDMNFIVRFDT
jgi:hypothetical protein